MHHSGFWHFAEHFWYGWWPNIPLTLVIAAVCAVVLVWLARESTLEPDPTGQHLVPTRWCRPTTVLAAFFGFLLWPLVIVLVIVLIVLVVAAICSSSDDDDD